MTRVLKCGLSLRKYWLLPPYTQTNTDTQDNYTQANIGTQDTYTHHVLITMFVSIWKTQTPIMASWLAEFVTRTKLTNAGPG